VTTLNILSAGAAQGLVAGLAETFRAQTGFDIKGEFGAVGTMADALRNGTRADLIILTTALAARLADEKLVVPSSISNIGEVATALAVRTGDPRVSVGNADDLRQALLMADAIFTPDTKASTAGIHVAKVLVQLGIAHEVAPRMRVFPNGATAMRHLASSDARRPIGCTQSTEIVATDGVDLSGSLPPGYELSTMYAAGVTMRAANARQAQVLINLLTSPAQRELRVGIGFVD